MVQLRRAVSLQALQPQQIHPLAGDARVPEQDVPEGQDVNLPVRKDPAEGAPRVLRPVAVVLQTGFRQRDVVLAQHEAIRLVRRARPDEEPDDGQRQGHHRGDDEHPPPAGQPVHAVEMLRRAGLDEARGEDAQHLADVEDASATAELASAVPGAVHVVDSREVGALESVRKNDTITEE